MYKLAFSAGTQLSATSYGDLSPPHKLSMLKFCIMEVMGTEPFMMEMQARSDRQSTGRCDERIESSEAGDMDDDGGDEEDTDNCKVYNDGGALVGCDSCTSVFHADCLGRSRSAILRGKTLALP